MVRKNANDFSEDEKAYILGLFKNLGWSETQKKLQDDKRRVPAYQTLYRWQTEAAPKKPYRRHNLALEQRIAVIKRAEASGYENVAREIGIPISTLYTWKMRLQKQGANFDLGTAPRTTMASKRGLGEQVQMLVEKNVRMKDAFAELSSLVAKLQQAFE